MKLHWAPTPPYARKALVAATPEGVEANLSAANLPGRIPALITEEGETL